jgi:hypothetical protein
LALSLGQRRVSNQNNSLENLRIPWSLFWKSGLITTVKIATKSGSAGPERVGGLGSTTSDATRVERPHWVC